MGTEPCLPGWARLSREVVAVELSRMITGQVTPREAATAIAIEIEATTREAPQ